MLCTPCSVSGKLCKNILVEVLIFLSRMHAKVQADYSILMTPQGLVRSVPKDGVALDRKTNCEWHVSTTRGLMLCLLLAMRAQPLCRAQGSIQWAWGRCAGAGAEQCCRLSYSRPATTAISFCDCDIAVPGSVSLAAVYGWCALGLAGCQFVTACLLSSPISPCCPHQAMEMPSSCSWYQPPFKPIS